MLIRLTYLLMIRCPAGWCPWRGVTPRHAAFLGEKIFAEEVEQAIAAHPGVRDVVVVGRPSPRWGQEVVAIVALRAGVSVTDVEIIDSAAARLARYKLPKTIIHVPAVRRSPVGKADYRWARDLADSWAG